MFNQEATRALETTLPILTDTFVKSCEKCVQNESLLECSSSLAYQKDSYVEYEPFPIIEWGDASSSFPSRGVSREKRDVNRSSNLWECIALLHKSPNALYRSMAFETELSSLGEVKL